MFYGLLTGLLVIGLLAGSQKKIIHYPTPFNVGKVVYQDKENNCFIYKAYRTKCKKNNQVIIPSL
jgi:hypothetical protein